MTDLTNDVDGMTGASSRRERSVPGSKGAVTDVVVSLGSAGAFTAFVEVVKAWLSRDNTRSLKLKWFENGKLQSLEVAGAGLDEAELTRLKALIDVQADG